VLALTPIITDNNGHEDMAEVRRLLRCVRRKTGMTQLKLTSMRSDLLSWGSSAGTILLNAIASTNLRKLELVRILPSAIALSDLIATLNGLNNLDTLVIGRCRVHRLTRPNVPHAMLVIPKLTLPKLKHLTLSHMHTSSQIALALIPNVNLVSLTLCHATTPSDFEHLIAHLRIRPTWCNLRHLQIIGHEIRFNALSGLLSFLAPLDLRSLGIGGLTTTLTTSALFHRINNSYFLPMLQHLTISNSPPDSFILQISSTLQQRHPAVEVSWDEF
jgi:hypothetical protein